MFHLGCDKSLVDDDRIRFTHNRWEDNASFGCKCPRVMKKVKDTLLSVSANGAGEGEMVYSSMKMLLLPPEWNS